MHLPILYSDSLDKKLIRPIRVKSFSLRPTR